MASIPLTWNDPMFSDQTNSGTVWLQDGETISGVSISDQSDTVAVGGSGSFTIDDVRISSREGVRIGGSGDVTINNSYIETTGLSGDHADGIQAYAPGATGNLTITNSTIVSHDQNATAGLFIADGYSGTFTFNNVVFDGGPFGLRIAADAGAGHDDYLALKDVYFVGPFAYGALWLEEVNANIHITQWENVRYATIVDGQLIPGDLIPPPLPVEGPTAPSTPTAPDAPTIASFSTDSGTAGDKITNDNTIELKGTAAAGSTVKIYDGTTQIGSTTTDSSGSWDYITKVLTDAKHTLTATATSSSGQTSAASSALAITVDTKAPTAPTIASHTVNTANQVVMSGSAEASSVVKVFDGTTQIGTATANSTGGWSYTTSALAAGSHSLTATATDAAGNAGPASTAFTASITGSSAPATPTSPTSPTSPTAGTVVESVGATTLVESGGKYYLNGSTGSGPTLKDNGVQFVKGSDGTWTPIGAEKTATGYVVAWKETSTGQYTAWNTDNNGNYVSHVSSLTGSPDGGSVSGTDSGLKSLETSFHQDLNGDGQVGTSTATTPTSPTPTTGKVVESAGVTSLVESGGKYYLNGSTGTGPTLKDNGVDFVGGSDGTWTPIGAEKTATGYQVAWKETSTGQYTAWNTDNNGNYVSHVSSLTGSTDGGSVSGTDSGLKTLETSFHQDLNSDGQIGTSSVATSSTATGSNAAIAGSTFIASPGNTTLTSTSGDDTFVGSSQADTFVFGANFGNDVIKGFVARGPAHDTIEFSKSVFDSFASVLSHATQSGTDVVIATGSDTLTLKNAKLGSLTSNDFHFA
ncbi:hypothetical protein ACVWYQ_001565 [Bradyrhizobium sp. USDA 3397]|uniref:Ig-like domain-containing protein n=1 Tax=Bradyrhizobium sp. CCBAU 45321 TaxID=1641878 RepID=UPI00230473AC|nr:Ig-like domain-containing protein [Bradyrhizobium sp. CCBAU 45321]